MEAIIYLHNGRINLSAELARYCEANNYKMLAFAKDGIMMFDELFYSEKGSTKRAYNIFNKKYGNTYVCSVHSAELVEDIKRHFGLNDGDHKFKLTFLEPNKATMSLIVAPNEANLFAQSRLSKPKKDLSIFTPRELMQELCKRGYRGTLTYTKEIDIAKL